MMQKCAGCGESIIDRTCGNLSCYEYCLACIRLGSWHQASKSYVALSETSRQVVRNSVPADNSWWYLENLDAAVSRLEAQR